MELPLKQQLSKLPLHEVALLFSKKGGDGYG